MSFVEMTRFLLRKGENDESGLFFLSERISQDPLENYLETNEHEVDKMNILMCSNAFTMLLHSESRSQWL